jgi:hypothetical protein
MADFRLGWLLAYGGELMGFILRAWSRMARWNDNRLYQRWMREQEAETDLLNWVDNEYDHT